MVVLCDLGKTLEYVMYDKIHHNKMDINLDDLWKNTVKQLRGFTRKNKINLRGKYLKADIIEIIREYLKKLENVVTDEPESTLEILPPELFREVVLHLSVSEMVTVCSVNRVISNLCEPLWKDKYQQLYGKRTPLLDPDWGSKTTRQQITRQQTTRPSAGLSSRREDNSRPNASHRLPHPLVGSTWKRNLLRIGIYGFGWNRDGELGLGYLSYKEPIPQRIPDKRFISNNKTVKIIQVSTGRFYTVCLDENGDVWSFGRNLDGQLGLDHIEYSDTPQQNPNLSNIIQVSAGGNHTVCRDKNGNVWRFGNNEDGQLGLGSSSEREVNTPHQITEKWLPMKITQVSAGGNHTVCLDENGNVWTFGNNFSGQLGLGGICAKTGRPWQIDPVHFRVDQRPVKITQVSTGGHHTICLDENGDVWGFGNNYYGQLGLGLDFEDEGTVTPQRIPKKLLPVKITQVSAGGHHTICLDENGDVWSFGRNRSGQLGLGPDFEDIEIVNIPKQISPKSFNNIRITKISTGAFHTVCVDDEMNVWVFGDNSYGDLGLGTERLFYLTPQKIEDIKAIQVSTGDDHTMLIGL